MKNNVGNLKARIVPGLRSSAALTVLCAAALLASPASAQDGATSARADATAQAASGGVDEILVTAQRRSESIQDIPVAISALGEKALDQIGFLRPNDVGTVVPNVQVSEVYGRFQPIFSIRGISQSDYNSNVTSPVGLYVDEAYIGAVFLHGSNFFDVERVEVLRGPQGTLYGKNTTGGAVNLISKTPDVDGKLSGDFRGGYGNYKAVSVDAAIEAPLIQDVLAARIAVTFADDEGYQKDVANNKRLAETHYWGVRGTLAFRPSDSFKATLRYTHGKTDQVATAPLHEGSLQIPGVGNVDFTGYQRPATLGFRERENDRPTNVSVNFDLVTLSATLSLPSFDIVSVTSYHNGVYSQVANTDGSPLKLLDIDWASKTEAYSQDLRAVTTGSDGFKLIVGGYYGREDIRTFNLFRLFGSPLVPLRAGAPALAALLEQYGGLQIRQGIVRESMAAYSQVRWDFADRWGLDVGLRYTNDLDRMPLYNISRIDQNGTPIGSFSPGNISPALLGAAVDVAFLPPSADFPAGIYLDGPYTTDSIPAQRIRNQRLTGKFGVDFKPNDDVMLYASFSRGYRSGNFNGGQNYISKTPDQGSYAKPEVLDAYEVGIKSEWFDRRLRLNAAAFQYDYTDQQFVNVVGVSVSLENAGASRIRGFEVEAVAKPIDGLTIQASASVLDSKFTRLSLSDSSTADLSDKIDLSGNRLISSPKFSATLGADYTIPLSGALSLDLHMDASYRSFQWFSAYNDKIGYGNISQKGYALANSRVTLINEDAGYQLALWGKNVFNKKYTSYAIDLTSGFGYDYFLSGTPRTYGLELSYKF
jgi:iron complex outermembrane receptor protein